MSDKQDPNHDHSEDDLLADFRAASGGDAAPQTPSPDGDEELADLDAFLNEFGQSGGDSAAAEARPDAFESAVPSLEVEALDELDMTAAEAVPELGADDIVETTPVDAPHELDLDTEHGGEVPMSDALDEFVSDLDDGHVAGGVSAAPSHETPDLFAADEAVSPHTADYPAADEALIADEEETEVGKRLDVSTIGVALLSLIIAAVVGWFAVSLHSQVAQLRADVGRLRQPPPAVAVPNPQLDAQLARINQRLNNLATTVTASVGHAGGHEQALSAVNARLDDLDKSVASLRAQLIALERTPSAKAATPARQPTARVKQPVKAGPAGKKRTATASGAWVVNVASLTDSKAAQSELTRLRHEGIKSTEMEKVTMNGRTWYRVRVTGFSSREEAQVYSDMIKNKLEATPWVGHR